MYIGSVCILFSLFYTILLCFAYFSKKRLKNFDNKIFGLLIIINIIGLITELLCCYTVKYMHFIPILNNIANRLYLIYLLTWEFMFTIYIFNITFGVRNTVKKKILENKFQKKLLLFFYFVLSIITIILPISYFNDGIYVYSYGVSTNFLLLFGSVLILFDIICFIFNRKIMNLKKVIPLFVLILCMILVVIIRTLNPGIILITSTFSFVTILMYFTIENPDLQMINELYKNKLLVEETYEDKSNFLFNMTQEVREPIFNINNIYNEVKDTKDINELQEGLSFINRSMRQLDFIINDVLDVATIDKEKVKFVNNRYNINNLYNDITIRVKQYIPKDIDFRCNINNNIPYLYGDSLKLKQVIMSILMNSVKQTKKGFIEFNIDTIEKYDVCRLIITINDSGGGISIDKINDILKTTTELSVDDIKDMEKMDINLHLCQKIIKLLGGNLMIKNTNNKGAKVMLTLDQRVYMEDDKVSLIDQYEYYINSSKQLLLVSQNKALIEKIKKRLRTENISITTSMYGKDAIDKIKYGKKYNLILMDDEMSGLSGYTTMQELKKLKGFHIPVIVMLGETKENIKEHYINDGFSDYVLVKDLNKELDKVIFKY